MSDTQITADKLVPLLSVSDIHESLAFYVDGLGFEKKSEWVSDGQLKWCMLEYAGNAAFMLQQFDKPAENKVGTGVTFYVFCNDALAFYAQVTAKGIEAGEPFIGNNMHVIEMSDPDGYRVSFESPVDA